MGNLDLKFYWAVFLRRLPYFILVSGFIAALGVTVAAILPPVYVSGARILVEPQQISDDLAQSTVPIDPYEQIQIIQQRVLTRANLLDLAEKSQMFADSPDASAEDIIKSMAGRITFTGSEPEDVGRTGPAPGAIVVRISFEAPNAVLAARGANEVVNLILAENVRIRSERATGTSDFFETEVEKLSESLQEKAREIAEFKTENVEALPTVSRRAASSNSSSRNACSRSSGRRPRCATSAPPRSGSTSARAGRARSTPARRRRSSSRH